MIQTFARLAACSSPPYPPALSTPAGVEREPNSPIWPCVLRERVQRDWSTGRSGCQFANDRPCAGALANGFPARISVRPTLPSWPWSGTSSLQSVGQIWLLAPLSAPAGVERGGGDRGGLKRPNVQHRLNPILKPTAINWNPTPIKKLQTP